MPRFPTGKFRDFFTHFEADRPQHGEGVRRLERAITDLEAEREVLWEEHRQLRAQVEALGHKPVVAPHPALPANSLLSDEAYWVKGWRTPPAPKPAPTGTVDISHLVRILAQGNDVSCGQTSCAMAINAMTGKAFTDASFNAKYRFRLMEGLERETGRDWVDLDFGPDVWDEIGQALRDKCPVVWFSNRPYSVSGRGHIMLITALLPGGRVKYADPNMGVWRETTREAMLAAEQYPQGSAVYVARPK